MTAAATAPASARRELTAAEVLLRSLPDAPETAWVHLDRAAALLGEPGEVGSLDADAAWRRLGELERAARHVEEGAVGGRRRGRWIALATVAAAIVGATVLAVAPPVGNTREVGRDAVAGVVGGEPGGARIGGGQRLLVHLGSAWHVETFGLTVRHRRPCRVTLVRRGRPQWSTRLSGGGGAATHRYEVAVPERVQRRGFEQLLVTSDPSDDDVEIGELRLDPP